MIWYILYWVLIHSHVSQGKYFGTSSNRPGCSSFSIPALFFGPDLIVPCCTCFNSHMHCMQWLPPTWSVPTSFCKLNMLLWTTVCPKTTSHFTK